MQNHITTSTYIDLFFEEDEYFKRKFLLKVMHFQSSAFSFSIVRIFYCLYFLRQLNSTTGKKWTCLSLNGITKNEIHYILPIEKYTIEDLTALNRFRQVVITGWSEQKQVSTATLKWKEKWRETTNNCTWLN